MTADRIKALEDALRPFAKSAELFPEPPGTVEFDQCIYAPAAGSAYNLCGDDLRRARAALAASRAAPDCQQQDLVAAAQVRVKPLAWSSDNVARGVWCAYTVWGEAGGYKVSVNDMVLGGILYGAYRQVYRTIGDAQAAAQADYEARILAALDLTPAPAPAVEPVAMTAQDAARVPDFPDWVCKDCGRKQPWGVARCDCRG